MKFWSKKFKYRLLGNFGLTFLAPFMGTNLIMESGLLESVYISLISSGIVTAFVFFRRVEKFGHR